MSMTELGTWEEYISIYGFERDIEDARMARILDAINKSVQQLYIKGAKDFTHFMPDYLGERVSPPEKTEAEKLADERMYVQMLVSAGFAVMETKQ